MEYRTLATATESFEKDLNELIKGAGDNIDPAVAQALEALLYTTARTINVARKAVSLQGG